MPFEDNVIIRFTVQQRQLQRALNQISDQLGNIGRQAPQLGRATQGMGQMNRQVQHGARQLQQYNNTAANTGGLLQDLRSHTGTLSSSFRMAASSISTGTQWLDKFSIQADRASMMMWKFSMAGIAIREVGMTMGAVAAGLGLVTKKMVDSFSMVDRIKRQFLSIYQSAEIGGKMVDQLVTDAVKIRYTVEQVLEAGRLLAIEGFNPKDLIYDMSDLAAGVNQEGITIVNATRAFVDATNGQFRRLKETFQITREDAMQFAPDAFQGPNNQISNQAKATDAIIRAIRAKYRGMNEATMQTIGGMLSNVDDAMVKSMAKMGQAVEGTVIGWLKTIMGVFEKIEAFADTGLGKAVANTLLWGTAISAVVSGIALLTAGMVGLLGVFAAYRVFIHTRGAKMTEIIDAEMKLLAINRTLAEIEAATSLQEIGSLQAKLELTRALSAERKAQMDLFIAERTGGNVALAQLGVGRAGGEVAKAKALLATEEIPRQIVDLKLAADASRNIVRQYEAQVAAQTLGAEIQTAELMALQEELLAQKAITREIQAQIAAKEIELRQAERIVGMRAAETATLAVQTGGTFAGGMKLGAGAVGKGIAGLFASLLAPIRGFVVAIETAIAAAGGAAAALGVVTGAIAVFAAIAVAGLAIKHVLDEDAKSLRAFRSHLDESGNRVKAWANTLPVTPAQRTAAERMQSGLSIVGKVGKQGSFGTFQGISSVALDMLMPFRHPLGVPGMRDRVPVGKRVMEASQGDIEAARQMVSDMVAAARNSGTRPARSLRGLSSEDIASMSEEDIRKITMSERQRKQMAEDVEALYEKQNAELIKAGKLADKQARDYAKQQLQSKDISAEQRAIYEQVLASTSPAQMLSRNMHETLKHAQEMVPELQDLNTLMEKLADEGKTDAEAKQELVVSLEGAKAALVEMEDAQEGLASIGLKITAEEQKSVDAAHEKTRLLEQQVALYDTIRGLLDDQKRLGMAQAAGMGNMGAVFGPDMAEGEAAAARVATESKERQKRLRAAIEWQRKAIEDETRQALDLMAPGAGSSAVERSEYERYRARQERDRMGRVAGEYKPLIAGAKTPEQKQRMERQLQVETAISERTAKEHEAAAENILLEQRIGLLEVERQKRFQSVESDAKLLKIDMKILDLKEKQARAAGDEVAVQRIGVEKAEARRRAEELTNQILIERLGIEMQALELEGATTEELDKNAKATHDAYMKEAQRLRRQGKANEAAKAEVDANAALRSGREGIIAIEEERLKYLEDQASMNNASVEEVEAQRQKLADQYEAEAGRYKPGSREEMKYRTQAADTRGDLDLDQAIGQWQAYRREQAITAESEADLLQIDLQILDMKERQAQIAGDEAAIRDIEAQKREAQIEAERIINQLHIERLELDKQMLDITGATVDEITANMQAQYQAHMKEAERLRGLNKNNEAKQEEIAANAAIKTGREQIVATEEDRLRMMEKMAERGEMTPEQVAKQREGVAKQYEWMASQYKPGSAEAMAWGEKAMDLRGGGIDDQIAAWEAYRKETALNVESEADLLEIDLSILDVKERQAKIAGDENAVKEIQVQKTERRRQAEEDINRLLMDRLNIEKQQMDTHGATQAEVEKNMQERYKAEMDEAARLRREGKPVEASKHEAAADSIVKEGREKILGIEEDRLDLMEQQRKQGLVTDRDVDAQRRKVAAHYRWMSRQFKPGSSQAMRYEGLALGVEGQGRSERADKSIAMLEAQKRAAALSGASARQLLAFDVQIARIKMQQAIAAGDTVAQMETQVDLAEKIKAAQQSALSTEEAKLSYMQTQADQGLISQDAVDAEKRQLAAMYQNRARQAAAGSQEYYENMNRALSLLGDDTEEKWSGIIGKILGAPQSLIDSVVSSGWITQGFGGMENQFGMGRGMQAEIASQSRREMVIRVSWDLGSVDRRLEAALPQAMNSFGRDLIRGMDAA